MADLIAETDVFVTAETPSKIKYLRENEHSHTYDHCYIMNKLITNLSQGNQ